MLGQLECIIKTAVRTIKLEWKKRKIELNGIVLKVNSLSISGRRRRALEVTLVLACVVQY